MSDEEQKDSLNSNLGKPDPTQTDDHTVNLNDIPDEELTTDQRMRKLGHRVINMTATVHMMVEAVDQMAKSIKTVSNKIGDVETKRRRDRIVFLFCTALLVTVVGFGGAVVSSVRDVAKGNSEQLRILKQETSPEAKARQAVATEQIIQRIDCKNQDGLRHILRGVPNVSVPPRTEVCVQTLGPEVP